MIAGDGGRGAVGEALAVGRAGEQRGRGAEERRRRGAEEQRSRGAEGHGIPPRLRRGCVPYYRHTGSNGPYNQHTGTMRDDGGGVGE